MRYKKIVGLCLIAGFFAGCQSATKKVSEEEQRTPAVALVTPKEQTPAEKPTQEGKATPQQIAKAIKDEPIPAEKIPAGKIFKSPAEISPEAAKIFRNINFDFDKYDIRPDARETLKAIGKYLLENPKTEVMIEGHCDERGSREYNLVLGEQRALSTRKFLVSLGVSPSRLHTVSYGKDMPLDPASNEEAWAKNRRAEFKLSK